MSVLKQPVILLGRLVIALVCFVGAVGLLIGQTAVQVRHLFMRARGRRMGWYNLWFQMDRVGIRSIGVVGLVTFCIGSILALQISPVLTEYGALSQLPTMIGVAMVRELGPLVAAIVLTGFAGASIAAELGTMAVGEELKALRAHAISPVRFLVVPRVLATVVMTTCLAVFSNAMGISGGMLTAWLASGMSMHMYLQTTLDAIDSLDLITGLFKASVFGLLIGSLACYLGMNVRGGAQGVGSATTQTVVISIVALVIVDLCFTFVFFSIDW